MKILKTEEAMKNIDWFIGTKYSEEMFFEKSAMLLYITAEITTIITIDLISCITARSEKDLLNPFRGFKLLNFIAIFFVLKINFV